MWDTFDTSKLSVVLVLIAFCRLSEEKLAVTVKLVLEVGTEDWLTGY